MSILWMAAAILLSCILYGIGAAFERVALLRGRAARWPWAIAMIAAAILPFWWLVPLAPSVSASPARGIHTLAPLPEGAIVLPALQGDSHVIAPQTAPPVTRAFAQYAWPVVSALMFLLFLGAILRLRRERRAWRREMVDGTDVLIAKTFGPAIVGIVFPEIVLPVWVLELAAPSRGVIVAHEAEHRRADDGVLLFVSLGLCIVLPWNAVLWMMRRRLRRAVEFDCDARVLASGVDRATYAQLLLDAWGRVHSRGNDWLAPASFAERSSGLGARVTHVMRPAPTRVAAKISAMLTVGLALLIIAAKMPAPEHPLLDGKAKVSVLPALAPNDQPGNARPVNQPFFTDTQRPAPRVKERTVAAAPVDTILEKQLAWRSVTKAHPLVFVDGVKHPELISGPPRTAQEDTLWWAAFEKMSRWQEIAPPGSVSRFGAEGVNGVYLLWSSSYIANGGAMAVGEDVNSGARAGDPAKINWDSFGQGWVHRRFAGIAITAAQRDMAIGAIVESVRATLIVSGTGCDARAKRFELQDALNDKLRSFLTKPADIALYNRRAVEDQHYGGRRTCP